jgi:molybdopterin/thiamine biosynthesis adenylyltransferase
VKRHLVFPRRLWEQAVYHLANPQHEQAAFAYAAKVASRDQLRLVVNEVVLLSPAELEVQTNSHVRPTQQAIGVAVATAVNTGRVLIHLHSHLWHGDNQFSATDTTTINQTFLWGGVNFQLTQAAIVVGLDEGAVDAVVWSGHEEEVVPVHEIQVVGFPWSFYTPTAAKPRLALLEALAKQQALKTPSLATRLPQFDRQIRAYGPELQQILATLRVGIVGASGTGSHVVAALAHHGVADIVVCDPESMGIENLNRIVGARYQDVVAATPKVTIAERVIKEINPWALVHPLQCSVLDESALHSLKAVDVLFGCTDTAASRMFLNSLACQYHIPYIDVGTGIFVHEHRVTNMGGQVHIVLPDTPCLDCRDGIDRDQAAVELLDADERERYRARGYVIGDEVPQPQVIHLNGLIVNQAISEFLNLAAAFKPFHPYLIYDALQPGFLAIDVKPDPDCLHCSRKGLGDGNPGRNNTSPNGQYASSVLPLPAPTQRSGQETNSPDTSAPGDHHSRGMLGNWRSHIPHPRLGRKSRDLSDGKGKRNAA